MSYDMIGPNVQIFYVGGLNTHRLSARLSFWWCPFHFLQMSLV